MANEEETDINESIGFSIDQNVTDIIKGINKELGKELLLFFARIPTFLIDAEYITANYMLKYLNSFTKATPVSRNVRILFQDKGPLILHFQMEHGVLTFCLSHISNTDQEKA